MQASSAAEFEAMGSQFAAMSAIIGLVGLFVGLVMMALMVWLFWRICSKAGFPGALSLLTLIPLANIGLLIYLAFAQWPVSNQQ